MWRIFAFASGALLLVYGATVWSVAQPLSGRRSVPLAARAEAARLESTVRALYERFPHRQLGRPEQLAAAGAWLESELERNGVGPWRQEFVVRGEPVFNLLARVGPNAGARVVVGAHYDAHPDTPGSDDNASGVAALLEVARLLGTTVPSCPVELALWTLEEPPFFRTPDMGSARHAAELRKSGAAVRFALSLETLGYYRDQGGSQRYPPNFPARPLYPSAGDFVLLIGDSGSTALTRRLKSAFAGTTSVPIESVNVPRTFPGADFSDHQSFWQAGYPAFMVTDSAFLRNPNYHRATDTPETLDFERLARAADGVAAMVLEACSAP